MVSYCDVADVQAELRAENAFDGSTIPTDTQVSNWIEQESDRIRRIADQEFGEQSVTDEYHMYAGGGLLPRNTPVISIDELEYNENKLGSEDWEVLVAGNDFRFLEDKDRIEFVPEFHPKHGQRRFRVDYTYGYTSTPKRIKSLCAKRVTLRTLKTLLNSDVEQENAGSEVRVGSIQIKKPEEYGTTNLQMLKSEIEMLENELRSGSRSFRTNSVM